MIRITVLFAIIMIMVAGMIPATNVNAADSPELYEYLNDSNDGASDDIYGNNWAGMGFTVGDDAHTVTSIRILIKRTGSPGTITVSMKETNGSLLPDGSDLFSGTIDGDDIPTSYTWYEIEAPEGIYLEAGEEYSIAVRAIAGDDSNDVQWASDTGGSLANAVASASTDGGTSWASETPADYLFEVWGENAVQIAGAAVFRDYLEEGDLLFVMEYINTYVPYYPYENPTACFMIALLDEAGTTTLAQTVMRQWGNQPGAIYLSADTAAGLDIGSQYYMALNGDAISATEVTYQLQAEDWYGTDLNQLDNWVILTATSMEDWWDATFIEYTTQYVLNEQGGVLFLNGIPYLDEVRPELFKALVTNPTIPTEPTETWNSAYNWEALLGPTLAGPLNALGDIFNISGQAIMGIGLFLMYGAIGGFTAYKGHTTAGILTGAPIILVGVYTRTFDVMFMGIALAVIVILGVWSFWWSRT